MELLVLTTQEYLALNIHAAMLAHYGGCQSGVCAVDQLAGVITVGQTVEQHWDRRGKLAKKAR